MNCSNITRCNNPKISNIDNIYVCNNCFSSYKKIQKRIK